MKSDQMYPFVGLRVNKDIYNQFGTLLIPKLTILTRKEMEWLIQHEIELTVDDVEQSSVITLIDLAVEEMKEIFNQVRYSKQIPLQRVREEIVPIIMKMSCHPDLSRILTHLQRHDEYTYRHSIGVALISTIIGKTKRLHNKELNELTIAAFLHDIGKVKIPLEILNKPGKLTADEFNHIKEHSIYGFELIKSASGVSYRQALVALQHHEREDGSGYPYGLIGKDIDPYSKIIAVADVFHAMISKRVYKNSIPIYNVLQEISQNAYATLEPTIVLNFLKRIMEMLIGHRIILSNGCEGKIIMIHPNDPINPLVEMNGGYIDLSKDKRIQINRIV